MPVPRRRGPRGPSPHERQHAARRTAQEGQEPIAAQWSAAADGWMLLGACRDKDPELFFPVGSRGPASVQVAAAKAVCHQCVVCLQCFAFAMRTGQEDGIWGGTSQKERLAMAHAARRKAQPLPAEVAAVPAGGQVSPFAVLLGILTGESA